MCYNVKSALFYFLYEDECIGKCFRKGTFFFENERKAQSSVPFIAF